MWDKCTVTQIYSRQRSDEAPFKTYITVYLAFARHKDDKILKYVSLILYIHVTDIMISCDRMFGNTRCLSF